MSKKKKNKDVSKLRAQVEFLKAQLKTRPATGSWREETPPDITEQGAAPAKTKGAVAYQLNPTFLRNDLRKTLLLTFLAGLLLALAYFTQNHWQVLSATLWKITRVRLFSV